MRRDRSQYVYVLTNISMPGLVKIGFTSRSPEVRAKEIGGATGVPTAFEVYYSAKFKNAAAVEKLVHDALAANRVNQRREFFRISPEAAVKKINHCCRQYIIKRLYPGIKKPVRKRGRKSRRHRLRALNAGLAGLSLLSIVMYHDKIDLRLVADALSGFVAAVRDLAVRYRSL